jgi:predicted nucleotidyltransferase
MTVSQLRFSISQKELMDLLKRGGVIQAFVFGSYARGEQTSTSELDLFIRCKRGVSLFDVFDLQAELERHTGMPVDLVTKFNPHFSEYIESELVELEL